MVRSGRVRKLAFRRVALEWDVAVPCSLQVEEQSGVAIVRCEGGLGQQQAREAAVLLWASPDWPGRSAVWDFRDAHFDVSGSDVREVANFVLSQQPEAPPSKVAFVAPRDADFGLARMFEVFRDDPRTSFRVFRDYDEALSWARSFEP